jgi:hypothetical protein
MLRSLFRRQLPLIVMCLLVMMASLSAAIAGAAFAKTAKQSSSNCSAARFSMQPLSCLPAQEQAMLTRNAHPSLKPQTSSALTVEQVLIEDLTGNSSTTFVPAETIYYTFLVNNTSGNPITATFLLQGGGTSPECAINLEEKGLTISTGEQWWYTTPNLCGDESAGTYPLRIQVNDQNNPNNKGSDRGSFTVNNDNLPYPSWWNGTTCDTTKVSNSQPLGTYLRGTPACGPIGLPYGGKYIVKFPGGWGESEWQCIELSMRFMYLAYGTLAYSAYGYDVVSNYPNSSLDPHNYSNNVLVVVPNNAVKDVLPLAGDILSYNGPTSHGHTTVVLSTEVDSNGNGKIYVIEQNDPYHPGLPAGMSYLLVNNWKLTYNGYALNWLSHTLDVWPQTASPGTNVVVSGVVLSSPNQTITINFGGSQTQVATNSYGEFAATITVPQIPAGSATVSVTAGNAVYSHTTFNVV